MEEDKVHQLIESILVSKHIENGVVKITNANVEISDGYMSEIVKVSVTSAHQQALNFIIKVAPTDPEFRNIVKLLYQSEIHFYDTILPLFIKLQQKYTGQPITFLPTFYKAIKDDCKETIVLEDMTPKGYVMIDRRFVFTDDHLTLCLKELGKFHALSLALQKHEPEVWQALDNGVDASEVFSGEVIDWFRDALTKAATLMSSKQQSISNKLLKVSDDFPEVIKSLLIPSRKYPSVIAHLDTWCNNFLFKHANNAEKTVEDVVLIDFQQATKASPVLDVACFLYINGSTHSITEWKDTLRVYYDSLEGNAKLLECPLDEFYSWEMFLDDWKDYSLYGMLKSVMGISLNVRDDKNVKNTEDKKLGDHFYVETWNEKTNERIEHLILHMEQEKFL